eukprot:TRINITY_DN524_c0_g1_i1.p1 TRINITY_DN524_c0_g1~~TRINITY_DN524_c0_g1_i1.p1  ORF type:complete len:241 (-),score=37.50 TRINITY_DN524_c0_g1_i1:567-1289(-)
MACPIKVDQRMSTFEFTYSPRHYRVDDVSKMLQFVSEYPFGMLITTDPFQPQETDENLEMIGVPQVTHLPFDLVKVEGSAQSNHEWKLVAHVAYANPQWKALQRCHDQKRYATALFHGPHAYISPSWYQTNDVPTWNYSSVRIYGIPQLIEEPDRKKEILQLLIKQNESRYEHPWQLDSLSSDYVSNQMKKIKVFEIPVQRIEGKFKMSQNRSEEDQNGAVLNLMKGGHDEVEMAKMMKS